MKKIYILALIGTAIISTAAIADTSSGETQSVTLKPGWNIVSVPRILSSHTFSVAETTDNFSIYILSANHVSGWATMSQLGQTEFQPLYGYFIQNKTGVNQTLAFQYKTPTDPNERIFSRTFSVSGWYSIGVANPTYSIPQGSNDHTDQDNVTKILNALSDNYSTVIDFTDRDFALDPDSVVVGTSWKAVIASDANTLYDFRDLKGYAVYITNGGAMYDGFANDGSLEPPLITPTPTPLPPFDATVSKNTAFGNPGVLPSLAGAKIGSFNVQGGTAEDGRISSVQLDFVGADDATTAQNMILKVGGVQQGITVDAPTKTGNTYSVSINAPKSTTVTVDVFADVRADAGTNGGTTETAQLIIPINGVTIIGLSTADSVQRPVSSEALQVITFAAGTLKVTKDSSSPVEQILTPANGVLLGNWKFAAKNEDLALQKVTFTVRAGDGGSGATQASNFGALYLKDGSTTLATGQLVDTDVIFSGFNLTIPASGSKILSLYSDLTGSGTQSPNTIAVWTIKSDSAPTDIDVTGSSGQLGTSDIDGDSDTSAADTTFATSTRFLYHNTKPVIAAASNTPTGAKTPQATDTLFIFTVTNSGTRDMRIGGLSVTVTISGGSSSGSVTTFDLYDGTQKIATNNSNGGFMSTNNVTEELEFDATDDVSGYFDNFVVSAGASKTLTMKADTPAIRSGLSSGQTVTLSTKINGSTGADATGIAWNMGGLMYYYTPVFDTEQGPFYASDSYPVNGGTLTY